MRKINLKKYKAFKEVEKNPALAVFRVIQEMEKKINDFIETALNTVIQKAEETIQKRIDGIKEEVKAEVKKETEDTIREGIKENIFKGISQLKGDKGDPIRGDKGETGPQGLTGAVGAKGERGLRGEKGEKGAKGDKPLKTIDYFTKEEQEYFMNQIVGLIKLKPLERQIKEILKEIKQLKQVQQFAGRQYLHGGGHIFQDPTDMGTGDNSTVAFTLPATPRDANSLKHLFVGGSAMFETDDWTRSGTTVTFTTAPPTGARVSNPAYRKS